MRATSNLIKRKAARIKLLLLDVDGVLTDGRIVYDSCGRDMKFFDVRDGLGVFVLKRVGIKTVLITAKASGSIRPRARDMQVDEVIEGVFPKSRVFAGLLKKHRLTPEEVCFVADDLVDLSLIKRVGLAVAVANATHEIKKEADYITKKEGGRGAVREVVELILKSQKKWKDVLSFYDV